MSFHRGAGRGGNPWNSGNSWNRAQYNEKNVHNEQDKVVDDNSAVRFKIAQEQIQASVHKHLQREYESSSDEEDLEPEPILESVLKEYTKESQVGLEKISKFLENAFQSGAGTCLICLSNVKRVESIWNCLQCYGFFHLICIQKWARDSIFQQKQAQEDLPEFRKTHNINWPCPKCRHEYNQADIPKKYYCFCGKSEDPEYQPFLVPHSCGEQCGKLLEPDCGYKCLLLCHPGPCPPCPKTVEVYCYCKKEGPKVRRCSDKFWSCGSKCGKPLLCKKHFCENSCHPNECPPCSKESIQACNCGLQKRNQPCMTPSWKCEKVCGKPFSCGFHSCNVICHEGSCGECPRSLKRTCPCGKSEFQLPCTQEIPTCFGNCGKLLECGAHYCSQKCHKDKCGKCLEIVEKVCRCGRHKKEVPCEKEYLCGSKCKRLKNCLRHPCNRKCCDMNCPPCEKQCGRTLPCGNHKCPSVCHRGQCYPCPEVFEIKCRCGGTAISVACGQEKKTKPPRCSRQCSIPPNCHHTSREPHRCHYGECPPCKQICGKDRKQCSHKCPAPCHSAVWQEVNRNPCPAGPWEAANVQFKRCNLPCPDCLVLVMVTCLGGHEMTDWPCFKAESYSCQRPCGRLLACENHYCDKPCHKVLGSGDSIHAGENCSECESECLKERPEGCSHLCPNPCHPGDCPPCIQRLKIKCHCAVTFLYVECSNYCKADSEAKEALLSCGNPCPKSYPCGHRCRSSCHSQNCPDSDLCKTKVKVSCKCGRIKKIIPCDVLRMEKIKFIDCVESCLETENEKFQIKQLEMEKKRLEEEERSLKEVERFEKKFQGRKRQRNRATAPDSSAENDKSFLLRYIIVSLLVAVFAAALIYFSQM